MTAPISSTGWRTVVSWGSVLTADRGVVEAHDGDVVRDAQAGLAQDAQGTGRHEVGRGEDPVGWRRAVGQQRPHAVLARPLAVVARDDAHVPVAQAGVAPGVPRPGEAVEPRGHVLRPGEDGEPAAAPLEEV